jgi:type VI secretion system secreted protein VgrG
VSQSWAGKNWGSMQIPRIGQEVIVSFLEGDPDRPIITGRVYNAEQTVPYDLPENATQSGMKSRSSKGGTPANFNEIRMEDKKGLEQLYIHAERNQDIVVEVDESHSVGHDRNKSIGHNETVTIGNNRTRIVKQEDVLLVGQRKTDSISQSYVIEVGENLRLVCGESILELNASGQINLTGVNISFYASGDAEFNTKGVLHLNNGHGPGATPDGQGIKGSIDANIKAVFPAPKTS